MSASDLRLYTWPARVVDGPWKYQMFEESPKYGTFVRVRGRIGPVFRMEPRKKLFVTDFTFGGAFFEWMGPEPLSEEHRSAFSEIEIPQWAWQRILLPEERVSLLAQEVSTVEAAAAVCCIGGLLNFMQRRSIKREVVKELQAYRADAYILHRTMCGVFHRELPDSASETYREVRVLQDHASRKLDHAIRLEILSVLREWVTSYSGPENPGR